MEERPETGTPPESASLEAPPTPTAEDAARDAAAEQLREQLAALIRTAQGGASWFYWIAGLSVINSVIAFFQGGSSFVVGLGITQVFDAIAMMANEEAADPGTAQVIRVVALVASLGAAAVFGLFGRLAKKGLLWAFMVGMVLYLFDGLLFLLVRDWLSLGFHAFALYCIYGGFSATKKLQAAGASFQAEAAA